MHPHCSLPATLSHRQLTSGLFLVQVLPQVSLYQGPKYLERPDSYFSLAHDFLCHMPCMLMSVTHLFRIGSGFELPCAAHAGTRTGALRWVLMWMPISAVRGDFTIVSVVELLCHLLLLESIEE